MRRKGGMPRRICSTVLLARCLLDLGAAALDQDNQHNYKEHAGNDSDKC
jgi:hypothetical protein